MQKLFKCSMLVLTLFGAMSLGQSALACSPNLPNYGNCINMQQQQQWHEQQRLGYEQQNSMYGGSSGYDAGYSNSFIPHTHDCKATKTGGRVCNQYNGNGTWVRRFEENAKGKLIVDQFIKSDKVAMETIYDAKTGRSYVIFYTLDGVVYSMTTSNIKGQEYTQIEEIFDKSNGKLVAIKFYKLNKAGVDTDWIKQSYQNDQKHGKEYEYDINNNDSYVVIREANWVNGVKHGEEKFFKQSMLGKPKVVRTVMWQNGKQVSQ